VKTDQTFNFSVYGTQGGSCARMVNGIAIFVTKPNCPGLDVGDEVPLNWDLQPTNKLARDVIQDRDIDGGESSFPDARSHWENWTDH